MTHRGGTASGGKVRVVMRGQRTAIGLAVVEPLLWAGGEMEASGRIRNMEDLQKVDRHEWQTYS
jgi:hypothetical protein